jgi:outer membrane protein assembly factor BamE (lipoprotein component of BamABCDE complex)
LGASVLATGACAPLRGHQGYIIDADLVNSVRPGVDDRQSVLGTLGKPSFTSQFNQGEWYYIARDTRNYAYTNPKVKSQITLKIAFDPAGNVTSVTRTGLEQVANIKPYGKTTPTLGKKRGFFSSIFGNIGTVGAGGGGPPGGDSGGGGRDTP